MKHGQQSIKNYFSIPSDAKKQNTGVTQKDLLTCETSSDAVAGTSTSANKEVTVESNSFPSCWNQDQANVFKEKYKWLAVSNTLGCLNSRKVKDMKLYSSSGVSLSQQWISGVTGQQQSLRKKIFEHKKSNAHCTAEKNIIGGSKINFGKPF